MISLPERQWKIISDEKVMIKVNEKTDSGKLCEMKVADNEIKYES